MTDEQGIVEQTSQPSQGMARRRLRQRKSARRTTHVSFRKQHLKDDEQIQVGPAQIDFMHV
jgi:hypothetical protein